MGRKRKTEEDCVAPRKPTKKKKSSSPEEVATGKDNAAVGPQVIDLPAKTAGCENLHSTCYISTVLQVIANNIELLELIYNIPTECEVPGSDKVAALQRVLLPLLAKEVYGFANVPTLHEFCKMYGKDCSATGDANEFFSELFESLADRVKDSQLQHTLKGMFPVSHLGLPSYMTFLDSTQDRDLEEGLRRRVGSDGFRELGDFLPIALNRARFNPTSQKVERDLEKFIYPQQFSSEVLGLGSDQYELVAVFVHLFKENTAHYKVNVKKHENWFSYDDKSVRAVKAKEVLKLQGDPALEQDQPIGTLFIYKRLEQTNQSNSLVIPDHVHTSSLLYKPKRSPELIVQVIDDAGLQNNSSSLVEDTVSLTCLRVYKEDLLSQVLSLVASRFSWRPERLVLRRMKTINDIFQVEQAVLPAKLTFRDLQKEENTSEGIQTIRFLMTPVNQGDPRCVFVKVFKQNLFWSLGLYPLLSTAYTIGELAHQISLNLGAVSLSFCTMKENKPITLNQSSLLSQLTQDSVIPVLLLEEEGRGELPQFMAEKLKLFGVVFRDRMSKDECTLTLKSDMNKQQVLDLLGEAVGHPADQLQVQHLDQSGKVLPALLSTDSLDYLITAMHQKSIPRVVKFSRLDVPLAEFEVLEKINVNITRLDQASEPVVLVRTEELATLKDVLDKVSTKLPVNPDADFVWEFAEVKRGIIWGLHALTTTLAQLAPQPVDEMDVHLVEVPVAGSLVPFFNHAGAPHNKLGRPGIFDISKLETKEALSNEIQDITGFGVIEHHLVDESMWLEDLELQDLLQVAVSAAQERPVNFTTNLAVDSFVTQD